MAVQSLATKPTAITSFFNDFLEPWNDWFNDSKFSRSLTMPKVNISESKDNYVLSVGAPGLHKKDFDIRVDGDVLTVSGHQEHNTDEKEEKMHRQEYNYTSFSRSFTLPDGVAAEKIEATYDGGVLKISLPKSEQVKNKPGKTIPVN